MTGPARPNRLPTLPAGAQRHGPNTPVWVDRDGVWRPGVVVASAGPVVTIRYRINDRGATGVDTVHWPSLAAEPRAERDTFVDPTE